MTATPQCGQPSIGWLTSESVEDGMDTLTCESVCEQHVPKGVRESVRRDGSGSDMADASADSPAVRRSGNTAERTPALRLFLAALREE